MTQDRVPRNRTAARKAAPTAGNEEGSATNMEASNRQTQKTSNRSVPGGETNGIEAIPGLGPIRARALKKAGFETVAKLQQASIADLCAVPGVTEIKAGQLLAYLHGEREQVGPATVKAAAGTAARRAAAPRTRRATPVSRTTAPPSSVPVSPREPARATAAATRAPRKPAMEKKGPPAKPSNSSSALEAPLPPTIAPAPTPVVIDAVGEQPLVVAARQVSAAANALLRTATSSTYTRAFARQIGKIAAITERIALDAGISRGGTGRSAGQLQKIGQLLNEIAALDTIGAKRQDRYADDIRDRRHKLMDAFDSDDISGGGQDDDSIKTKTDKSDKGDKKGRRHRGQE